MKKLSKPTFVSTNLILGGIVLIITSALIVAAKPSNITIFTTTFSGNKILLSKVLTLIGCLSTTIGYAIRK